MTTESKDRADPLSVIVAKAFNLPNDEAWPPMEGTGFFTLQYSGHLGISFKCFDEFAATILMSPEMAKRLARDLKVAIEKMELGGGIQ